MRSNKSRVSSHKNLFYGEDTKTFYLFHKINPHTQNIVIATFL